MLGEFHRRITNEPVNPGLRGRIGRSSDVVRRPRGTVARTRRHADDRAGALMHHQPCCGARAQKGLAKVAPDGEVPGVRCHLPKILIARAARIVDQCVNPLVRGNDLRERVVYRRFLSHVRDECVGGGDPGSWSAVCASRVASRSSNASAARSSANRRAIAAPMPALHRRRQRLCPSFDPYDSLPLFDGMAVASVATYRRLPSTSAKALFRGRWSSMA